jgi:hypothetical protein
VAKTFVDTQYKARVIGRDRRGCFQVAGVVSWSGCAELVTGQLPSSAVGARRRAEARNDGKVDRRAELFANVAAIELRQLISKRSARTIPSQGPSCGLRSIVCKIKSRSH